jgi:phosphatidylinositol 4-kinase
MGGVDGPAYLEFRRLFREGFEAARKHCDSIISKCMVSSSGLCTNGFAISIS